MAEHIFSDGAAASAGSVPVVTGVEYIDALLYSRDEFAARLAEISAAPKPSYSVHGHQFSWTEYQQYLLDAIERCNRLLSQGQPFEVVSQGLP